jgi:hypothetical protein
MGEELRDKVKERYAGAALTVLEGTGSASCCGSAGERGLDSEALGVDWTGGGYSAEEPHQHRRQYQPASQHRGCYQRHEQQNPTSSRRHTAPL